MEGIIFHRRPIGLEEGVRGRIHPVELIGEQALHLRADALALLGLHGPSPLVHHRLQVGIVDAHVIRLPALEKAHRALVDVAQRRQSWMTAISKSCLTRTPIDRVTCIHQVDLRLHADLWPSGF